MIEQTVRNSFIVAARAVKERSEEINKLNVFPVPDGDTGTNMSLTLATVVSEIEALPADATMPKLAAAVTHGSLMGARGNSGVITSQILRGLAEGLAEVEGPADAGVVASAFRRAVKVAFAAVRKPVEGTILTVLRDVSKRADMCEKKHATLEETFDALVAEAFESVARTPDLLPVLKENGVVDSGAFGFAIFLEAFCANALGREGGVSLAADKAMAQANAKVAIELNDDWEGSEFRYCTEFLFKAEQTFDEDATRDFLATQGDCELLVGAYPDYKIHVHTDRPDHVLDHMLAIGQIFNVFIHNMDMEAHERTEKIAQDKAAEAPVKPLGVIAVAAGSGQAEILRSLGVDVVVEGGQTMNPSTADILAAAKQARAEQVIVLPNNGNIIMAAQSAAAAADFPMAVVTTRSVPQGFSAMFAFNPTASLEDNAAAMAEVLPGVHDGEITHAVRDSQTVNGDAIHSGDVIGLVDDKVTYVGSDVCDMCVEMVKAMQADIEGDTLTVLAGLDMPQDEFEALVERLEDAVPDLDVDAHRGEQPLYPIVLSIE
ncbi:MAG: DAK2 domain-containing protein [Coriobacteriaceae bacterium]|nr:DAK2 domain-containing protein [Coriobacteriaceae bacterium]MDD7112584.1 DAK2 domain-containing protein [Coriobacteriaceae bacterium]MDY5809463.1 DAK2 domain-containing protein [Coriobacteriales bacterium]